MLLDEYTLTQFLGKGTFGEVYLTTKKDSNFLYATKRMSKEFVEDPKYLKYFNNEITILRKLHHKNIVRLEDLKKTANHYYVIMEYCNGGTLTECLEKYKNIHHSPFTEEIVQHIMRQIVSAINYIHDLRIIHRDLKLDNILVKFENETDKNQLNLLKSEVKIIDFGFAAYKTQAGLLQTAIGSPMNMDPLILKKFNMGGAGNKELGYDEKADIWSLGTLCYQMLIGHCAFDAYNMKELVSKVEEGTYKVPTNLSKEVVSFLNAMLQYNPEKRMKASELIKHAFLIKSISDFTRIDMNKVSKKVYGGELKINIRENNTIWSIFNEDDEKMLNNIPGALFPTETPISESQYLDNFNPNNENNGNIISREPINIEKNFIQNEFKSANSAILNSDFEFGRSNSNPTTETIKIEQNSNQQIFKTPIKNININQNIARTAQIPQLGQNGQINRNNMITLTRKLENGQIVNINQNQPMAQRGPIQNNQINMNLINKFQQNTDKQIIPNGMQLPPQGPKPLIQNNINQNQINAMQKPPVNLPHGPIQFPNGQVPNQNRGFAPLGQIQQNPNINKLQGNQIQTNQAQLNKIQNIQALNRQNLNNPIQQNQILNRQMPNNLINNGIQNNQLLNRQIQNNQLPNNQIVQRKLSNNLLPNNQLLNRQLPNNQIQNNQILNNQIPNNQMAIKPLQNNQINQVPMNAMQKNQIPINNPAQNTQIRNNQIQNNLIQNKQLPINMNQQKGLPLNQMQTKQFPLNKISNIQVLNKVNTINPNINRQNPINQKLLTPIKTEQIRKVATIKQNNIQPQINRPKSPIKQIPINQLQSQKGHIFAEKSRLNQVLISPRRQNQRYAINNNQQIQPINTLKPKQNPLLNISPHRKQNSVSGNNKIFRKIPLDNNRNHLLNQIRLNTPLAGQENRNLNQIRNIEQIVKNNQNNRSFQQPLVVNRVLQSAQRVMLVPAATIPNIKNYN